MVGLCNNAFEGVIVTDELERGCKNSDYGLFEIFVLRESGKKQKNVRTVELESTYHKVGMLTMTFSH
jgi:hypothetical protein